MELLRSSYEISAEQYESAVDSEVCEFWIQRLERERMKITRTGRLSEEQDRRLNEIDAEIDYWIEQWELLNPSEEDQ
jgi:hypothetical protein